jgi:hypothetical protein
MNTANLTRHLIALRRARDRQSGLRRRRLPARWWERLPTGERLYVGQGSVSDPRRHLKYVDRSEPLYPFTWGELGREWLIEQYTRLGVALRRGAWLGPMRNGDIPPALFFQPGLTPGDWIYVDIAACYAALLDRWPLETRYVHAVARKAKAHLYRPAGPILPTVDLLACKPLRLAVWGTIRGGRLQWRGAKGKWGATELADRYTQPGLAGLVLVTVHEVAWRAVHELGARMWLTDAAILPLARLFDFTEMLKPYGLRARVQAVGSCELTGHAAYRVGDKRSELFGRVTPKVSTLLKPLPWRAV